MIPQPVHSQPYSPHDPSTQEALAIAQARWQPEIRSYPVPLNRSKQDWLEEIEQVGSELAWQAACQFDPSRGVPLVLFVSEYVIENAWTVCRRERRNANRFLNFPQDEPDDPDDDFAHSSPFDQQQLSETSNPLYEELREFVEDLPEPFRQVIEQRYWRGCTEQEAGAIAGISQSAASKREAAALLELEAKLPHQESPATRVMKQRKRNGPKMSPGPGKPPPGAA